MSTSSSMRPPERTDYRENEPGWRLGMFLKHLPTSGLVEVLDFSDVFDPFAKTVRAKSQAGEDTMDIGLYPKAELVFPSGEPLPLCWRDSKYRAHVAA